MAAVDSLLVEVRTDSVEPLLRINVHHRELDGRAFVLVETPRGIAVYERAGSAFIRVGATKRRLYGDERLRLVQNRRKTVICRLTSRSCRRRVSKRSASDCGSRFSAWLERLILAGADESATSGAG